MTKTSNEKEVVQKILHGDTNAMKELYDMYIGRLNAICSRYITDKETVRDVLQDSFIKIFESISSFEYRGSGSLLAWTTRIVVNESIDKLKEQEHFEWIHSMKDVPDIPDDEMPEIESIPQSAIMGMIQSLPTGYRTVFNLYVFENKSHKEIASLLHIKESTSASQLYRAKAILREEINRYNQSNT